jgi:hypothetical protein
MASILSRLSATQSYNVRTFRTQPLAEISGSLGDLGTLLPILVALTIRGSISLPATLLFTGLSNILTGLVFGIPLPVQPMKAIAAVALVQHFSMAQMAAAGIVMGVFIGILSLTGTIGWAEKKIPGSVVKGIMVGAGLTLCISAGKESLMGGLSWTGPWWGDNLIVAIVAALILLISLLFHRFPYALVVFVIGLVLSVIRIHTTKTRSSFPSGAMQIPTLVPTGQQFLHATFSASLGQLPLTLLNSIIAVTALSHSLLPSRPAPSTTSLGVSITLMNLIAPWFGGMPACHGSGGLAGQYRFGARSGSSIILLGLLKVALGFIALFKGHAVARVLAEFPRALLGVMVIAAGVELARAGISLNDPSDDRSHEADAVPENGQRDSDDRLDKANDQELRDRWMVLLVTVATLLTFKNDAVGFVAGMSWHWGIKISRSQGRHGQGHWLGSFSWRQSAAGSDEERRGLLS